MMVHVENLMDSTRFKERLKNKIQPEGSFKSERRTLSKITFTNKKVHLSTIFKMTKIGDLKKGEVRH